MEKLIESLHVFLGDASPHGPYLALQSELEQLMATHAQLLFAGGSGGELLLGPPERYCGLLLPTGVSGKALAEKLSHGWSLIWVRHRPGRRSCLVLLRQGAVADVVGDPVGSNGDGLRSHSAGDPSRWLDLVGARRNASRLENAWAMSSDADALLENTSAIVGFSLACCRGHLPESTAIPLPEF